MTLAFLPQRTWRTLTPCWRPPRRNTWISQSPCLRDCPTPSAAWGTSNSRDAPCKPESLHWIYYPRVQTAVQLCSINCISDNRMSIKKTVFLSYILFKDVLHTTCVIMLCKRWTIVISANYFRNACVKNFKKYIFFSFWN